MKKIAAAIALLFAATTGVSSQEIVLESQLGDETIFHPTIAGFKEVHSLPSGVFEFFKGLTPNTNILLATYILDEDYEKLSSGQDPSLRRQISVQTVNGYENHSFSQSDFDQVKEALNSNLSVDGDLGGFLNEAIEKGAADVEGKNDFLEDLKIEAPTVIAAGVNKPSQLSYTMLMNVAAQTTNGAQNSKIVFETNILRASNRVVYIYTYESFNGDISWVQNAGNDIAKLYMAENPNGD